MVGNRGLYLSRQMVWDEYHEIGEVDLGGSIRPIGGEGEAAVVIIAAAKTEKIAETSLGAVTRGGAADTQIEEVPNKVFMENVCVNLRLLGRETWIWSRVYVSTTPPLFLIGKGYSKCNHEKSLLKEVEQNGKDVMCDFR